MKVTRLAAPWRCSLFHPELIDSLAKNSYTPRSRYECQPSPPRYSAGAQKPAALDVFAVSQFRWLLGNVAFFAMQGQMLTRTLLAWELTGEATSLAYINLVVAVPLILRPYSAVRLPTGLSVASWLLCRTDPDYRNEIYPDLLLRARSSGMVLRTAFVAGCAFPFIMPAKAWRLP